VTAAAEGLARRIGEKVSILYRIQGDPDHPFSEVVGLLQRVGPGPGGATIIAVCRRDGSVVEVAQPDVVRMKFVPTSSGPGSPPPRIPPRILGAWRETTG